MQAKFFMDQYGNKFFAETLKELKTMVRGRVSRMYEDKKDGSVVQTGYVIGKHWLTWFIPFEKMVTKGS